MTPLIATPIGVALIYIYIYTHKDVNIGFDGYIGTWILRIYIDGYFYMNIEISEIKKNILKFMQIVSKNIKMTLIIKYIY